MGRTFGCRRTKSGGRTRRCWSGTTRIGFEANSELRAPTIPSTLSWLSHSETERRRALDVIDLFRERGTQDQLGIGRVRDAFSDLLFPGTSTIQTRAAYFLFVPWMYLRLERLRVSSADIRDRARRREGRLIQALDRSGDTEGLIGRDVGASVSRLPSEIYWRGLGVWGIRRTRGSRSQYHRSLDAFYRALDRRAREEIEEDPEAFPRNWHAGLPEPPDAFPDEATFQLRGRDATYLQERIFSAGRSSVLAFLVERSEDVDEVDFPWQHPVTGRLPEATRENLRHARNFSEVIHGAALLYNLMMAEADDREELRQEYREDLDEWTELVEARMPVFRDWDRASFWQRVEGETTTLPIPTRNFVNRWLDLAIHEVGPADIVDHARARDLISDRELALKRGRARLHNARALELWGGASGANQFEYRWTQVQAIVRDIRAGLRRAEPDAVAG